MGGSSIILQMANSSLINLRISSYQFLFATIILLGTFARVWEFGSLPPGLSPDEASTGVDAYSLLHYGVDRNGESFPVHFIAWGGGQNALYAYLILPFVALGGLNVYTVRLPMLMSGLLTLPLVYWAAARLGGKKLGLLATFLLAISPWHIMLSRWGLESNILPFVFLLGFICLLKAIEDSRWLYPAGLFLALCLYAYGTAYAFIPIFLALAIPIFIFYKRVQPLHGLLSLAFFFLAALPIGLFIGINFLDLHALHAGPITIPLLSGRSRYETVSTLFSGEFFTSLAENLRILLGLLVNQSDKLPWNSLEPYGYFYRFTFPLAVIGAVLFIPRKGQERGQEKALLLAWLTAALSLGLLQQVNANRLNLVFIPLLICIAGCLLELSKRAKWALPPIITVLLVGFVLFNRDYHNAAYRQEVGNEFADGLLPALELAREKTDGEICVTADVNMPYIYALFGEPLDPREYNRSIEVRNPNGSFRDILALDRYAFGLKHCAQEPGSVYVLKGETLPEGSPAEMAAQFGAFSVFVPASQVGAGYPESDN